MKIPQIRRGGKATLIHHSVYNDNGRFKIEASNFSVWKLCRRSRHWVTVQIDYIRHETGKKGYPIRIYSGNNEFWTIEIEGKAVYDSRLEIPCDTTKWQEEYKRIRAERLKRKDQNERTTADFSEE